MVEGLLSWKQNSSENENKHHTTIVVTIYIMKTGLQIFLSLFLTTGICFAQEASLDIKLLRLNGLEFYSKKNTITRKFGKPKRVFEPNNECGFRSEAEQGKKYYQLSYDHVAFVGNDREGYGLESADFNQKNTLTLNYGKYKLNHKLTKDEFIKLVGQGIKNSFNNRDNGITDVLLYFKNADDGLIFSFKSGYLIKIAYWSPC